MSVKNWITLAAFIALCQSAGIVGSLFTFEAIDGWYNTLMRPELAPPNWIFGPVWTTLYTLMGIASFLVWRKRHTHRIVTVALGIFVIQLILNALWSIIFFGLHSLGGALIEIILLWLSIFSTIILFWKISKPAALLLIPYLAWVSFASYLTFGFWWATV